MKKILYLTIKKKWFDQIMRGQKKSEYRICKSYWNKRIFGKTFDEVYFRNGYSKDSPFMRVECKGIDLGIGPIHLNSEMCFIIRLGRVLEVGNYNE